MGNDSAYSGRDTTFREIPMSKKELMGAVHKLKKLKIVGADINELSPHYDQSGMSTVTACKILRELVLTIE